MKKLLTFLGSVSLTTLSATSVVACGPKIKHNFIYKDLNSINENWSRISRNAFFYESEIGQPVNSNKLKAIIATGFDNYKDFYKKVGNITGNLFTIATGSTSYIPLISIPNIFINKPIYIQITLDDKKSDFLKVEYVHKFQETTNIRNGSPIEESQTLTLFNTKNIKHDVANIQNQYNHYIQNQKISSLDAIERIVTSELVDDLIFDSISQSAQQLINKKKDFYNYDEIVEQEEIINSFSQILKKEYKQNVETYKEIRRDIVSHIIINPPSYILKLTELYWVHFDFKQ